MSKVGIGGDKDFGDYREFLSYEDIKKDGNSGYRVGGFE